MNYNFYEGLIANLLRNQHLTLAVAESCTGGLISHRITNIPGASEFFKGGIVAYTIPVKMKLLGVRWETINDFSAVNPETVQEMARGVRLALEADIGISISGIAGPSGGTPQQPVGTTWIGLSAPGLENTWEFHFQGDRLSIKEEASNQALRLLYEYLETR